MSPPSRPVSCSGSRAGGVLADLVEEITNRLQAGDAVDVEAYAARHPEHAEELRKLIPTLGALAAWSGGAAAPGGEPTAGTLGDYRILREVGRGGMGVVYEAEQISLGRRVALKVLPFAATMDPRRLTRFHNEARAAASLEHPHIVPVYGVGSERGVHFYAMKLIDGRSLAEFLEARRGGRAGGGPTPDPRPGEPPRTAPVAEDATSRTKPDRAYSEQVARVGAEAADALEHAHTLGIVHRDVKPANLMLDGRGHVWVADFGLAQTGQGDLTMTGDLVGTLRYMSPEQALAQHGLVDHRADVYSLGVTLYELLTLRPAVGGKDRQEVLKNIAFEEPVGLRKVVPEVPVDLETVVQKAMAKGVQDRYATAGELAADLRRFLDGRPVQARRPTVLKLITVWGRRRVGLAWAVGVGLLLGVVALGVGSLLLWREKEQVKQALADKEVEFRRAEQQNRRAEDNFIRMVNTATELLHEIDRAGSPDHPEVSRVRLAQEAHLERLIQGFLDSAGTDPVALKDAAWCLEHVGSYFLSREEFSKAEKKYRTALALYESVAAEHPEDPTVHYPLSRCVTRLSRLLFEAGRLEEARHGYRRALAQHRLRLRLYPDWRSHADLAWLLVDCPMAEFRDPAEGLQLARRALELAQENGEREEPACWSHLGKAHYRLGNWREAHPWFLKVYRLTGEDDPWNCFFLAMSHYRLGQKDEARKFFDWGVRWMAKNPHLSSQDPLRYRAEAAALLGVPDIPPAGKGKPIMEK